MNDSTNPDTTRDQREAQVLAHALGAVAHHITEHGLPGFLRISSPSAGDLRLDIEVHPDHFLDWTLTQLVVTDSDITPVLADEFERVSCDGLLADTGLRVRVWTVWPAPFTGTTHLSAVPA